MKANNKTSKHDLIQAEIFSLCSALGYISKQEYSGIDWRADIFTEKNSKKIAFEIQITPQSLEKTLERQGKYIRDNIICCWLFEKSPSKLLHERPDLPLFDVSVHDSSFYVSLSDRKTLPLSIFIEKFLDDKIKFCKVAQSLPTQKIKIVFYQMECWNCKAVNHNYYVDTGRLFKSACNAKVHPYETLWSSDKVKYLPEVIELVNNFARTPEGKHLKLSTIKERYSNATQSSYKSFGCHECDSIFGDWFVMEEEIDVKFGEGQVAVLDTVIKLDQNIKLNIPHWCYPEELHFCDETSF